MLQEQASPGNSKTVHDTFSTFSKTNTEKDSQNLIKKDKIEKK